MREEIKIKLQYKFCFLLCQYSYNINEHSASLSITDFFLLLCYISSLEIMSFAFDTSIFVFSFNELNYVFFPLVLIYLMLPHHPHPTHPLTPSGFSESHARIHFLLSRFICLHKQTLDVLHIG